MGILTTQEGYEKSRRPLKWPEHRLTCSQVLTLGPSRGTVTQGASDIQEETELCSFGARTGGAVAILPVLGVLLLCSWKEGAIFPELSPLPTPMAKLKHELVW